MTEKKITIDDLAVMINNVAETMATKVSMETSFKKVNDRLDKVEERLDEIEGKISDPQNIEKRVRVLEEALEI